MAESYESKPFTPDDTYSRRIKSLTFRSQPRDIRIAFIVWNRQVLVSMIDDILRGLEKAYEPYEAMTIIRDEDTADAKDYIHSAIEILREYRVIYGEILDGVNNRMILSQFLTFMGVIDTLQSTDFATVSYGMSDAKMIGRYRA